MSGEGYVTIADAAFTDTGVDKEALSTDNLMLLSSYIIHHQMSAHSGKDCS